MTPATAPPGADAVSVPTPTTTKAAARWGKRLGVFAFCFFLIKGLAWLVVPAAVAYFASR